MAHTAARPATTWGPAVLNIYCLYMVGTAMASLVVMDDQFHCFFLFKAFLELKDGWPFSDSD